MRIFCIVAITILVGGLAPAAAQTSLYNKKAGQAAGVYPSKPAAKKDTGGAKAQAPALQAQAKRAANMALMKAQRAQMEGFLQQQQTQMDSWLAQKMAAQALQPVTGASLPDSKSPVTSKAGAPSAAQGDQKGAAKGTRPVYNDPRKAPAPPKVFKDF